MASGGDQHEPTAASPWTVPLCWVPTQNHGRVSVYPGRAPVWSVWGLLNAGEPVETVASEFALPVNHVRILNQLRLDAADIFDDLAKLGLEHPDDTRSLLLCVCDARRGGQVTVGDSRLPVAPVLRVIAHRGEDQAAASWPQLTQDQLAVLARLARDLSQTLQALDDSAKEAMSALAGLLAAKDRPHGVPAEAWDHARDVLRRANRES